MDVTLTQKSPILMEADVKVPWDKVAPHFKSSLKTVAKSAQVPGFRKGKVPAVLLKKRYHDYILSEVAQKVVPESMDEWIKEKEVKAVGSPRLSEVDMKENDTFAYTALIDILPEVELKEWRGLEAEKKNVTVTDHEVSQELEHMVQQATTRDKVTDRPVEKGDLVNLQITALDEDGVSITDLENYELNLAAEAYHPNLAEAAIGAELGDDVELVFDGAADDSFEEWRGKKVKLYVEILEITRVNEPELSDEFAKSKDFENLEALRKDVEQKTLDTAREGEERRLEGALIEKMMEAYDFDVPDSMIQAEAEQMVQQQFAPYAHMFQAQGEQQYREMMQNMIQMSYPQATSKVRADLVLDKMVENEKLELEESEINEEMEKYLESFKVKTIEELRAQLEENGTFEVLQNMLLRQKAVKQLVNEAKITLVDKLTSEIEAEAAAKAAEEAKAAEDAEAAAPDSEGDEEPAAEATDKSSSESE